MTTAKLLIEGLINEDSSTVKRIEKLLIKYASSTADILRTRKGTFEVAGVTKKELDSILAKVEEYFNVKDPFSVGLTYSAMDSSGWRWHVTIVGDPAKFSFSR